MPRGRSRTPRPAWNRSPGTNRLRRRTSSSIARNVRASNISRGLSALRGRTAATAAARAGRSVSSLIRAGTASTRSLSRVAGRGLARAVPYVGTALVAADIARMAVSAMSKKSRNVSGDTSDTIAYIPACGGYAKDARFSVLGASRTREVYGQINDPNCIYVGFASLVPSDTLIVAWAGVLRALFKKAGITIPDMNRPLKEYLYTVTAPVGANANYYRGYINLIYMEYNATTGVYNDTPVTVAIADTTTLLSLASDSQFQAAFQVVSATAGNFENRRYIRVNLTYKAEDVGATFTGFYPVVLASINLDDATIHLSGNASCKMQNRTVATAGENDIESIDSVPLTGKYYDLKNLYPVCNTQEASFSTRIDNGMMLVRSAELSTDGFKVVPPSGYFKNCEKSGNLTFAPGTICKFRVSHGSSTKGWTKFLLSYSRTSSSIAATGVTRHTNLGKMRIVALERSMRTSSLQPVTLNYESEVRCSSYTTVSSHESMITDTESNEYNNVIVI